MRSVVARLDCNNHLPNIQQYLFVSSFSLSHKAACSANLREMQTTAPSSSLASSMAEQAGLCRRHLIPPLVTYLCKCLEKTNSNQNSPRSFLVLTKSLRKAE